MPTALRQAQPPQAINAEYHNGRGVKYWFGFRLSTSIGVNVRRRRTEVAAAWHWCAHRMMAGRELGSRRRSSFIEPRCGQLRIQLVAMLLLRLVAAGHTVV